ncbi:MAG: sugar transferase [Candidatus Hydrothermae bacterium]|nr:sugar transferase [Candidatus Hydrothermae bacterium]
MCVRSERLKRVLDVVGASVGIVLFGPLMLVIALLIWITMGRPVLFRQERAGRYGRPFRILKFRTMLDLRDASGQPLPDEQRLTRLGRWLRRFSLDELPEFFNVLRGEMSLVGPRPLYVKYIARYTPEQARRLEVRPGITGWAQIHGRNLLPWKERFALDVWYVDHWNLCLDLKILFMTVFQVIRGTGISARGHATMPEFLGTEEQESEV